jgi:hypothetical protein
VTIGKLLTFQKFIPLTGERDGRSILWRVSVSGREYWDMLILGFSVYWWRSILCGLDGYKFY